MNTNIPEFCTQVKELKQDIPVIFHRRIVSHNILSYRYLLGVGQNYPGSKLPRMKLSFPTGEFPLNWVRIVSINSARASSARIVPEAPN